MYRFNYNKLLHLAGNLGWFQPGQNQFLEIWTFQDPRPPLVKRGPLDEGNIRDWLAERPMSSALGGLRLIICHPHQQANDAGRFLPFQKSTFEEIVQSFHLPLPYLQAVFDGLPTFASFETGDALNGNGVKGYLLKTMWASGMNFALAISQDAKHGVNVGILDGCLHDEVEVVIDRITAAKTHSCHPLLVPTILCELVTERNVQRTKASEGEMNSIELDTGEHIYEYRVQPDLQSIDSGGSMTARVNGTATTSNFTAANIKSTILAFKAILANLDTPSPSSSRVNPQLLQRQYSDGRALRECIEHCLGICYNLQLEAEQIRARAETQISAIYSLIAQRDSVLNLQVVHSSNTLAEATRRDSSAMKTIAVLTILFLPGTFVAAFFAMPLFNWDALDPSEIRKPRFYIYWVVTLPCTFFLVAVWILWIRINKRLRSKIELLKKRQPKDKESSRPSLGSNNSFAKWRPRLATRRSKGEARDQVVGDEGA